MALHPEVLADLLDREVRQARAFLGRRAGDLHRDGHYLVMTLVRDDGSWVLRLDAERYDAEPFDVALVDEKATSCLWSGGSRASRTASTAASRCPGSV